MDPRDRDAISDLFRKLHDVERQAGPRDAEAERLIADETQRLQGAPYYMAQTIVMQDMALTAKQRELDDLKRRLDEAERRPAQSTGSEGGFLSRVFGGGSTQADDAGRQAPQRGPWGSVPQTSTPPSAPQGQYAAPPSQPYPQQGYAPQPQAPAPQPGGFGSRMGGGGFLAGAAQTAMGVAGGVVLGNAIGSMFGGHHGGLFGGGGEPTEVVNETTNIYEDNGNGDVREASDPGGYQDDGNQDDGYQDASYDDGGFDDSGSDDI